MQMMSLYHQNYVPNFRMTVKTLPGGVPKGEDHIGFLRGIRPNKV